MFLLKGKHGSVRVLHNPLHPTVRPAECLGSRRTNETLSVTRLEEVELEPSTHGRGRGGRLLARKQFSPEPETVVASREAGLGGSGRSG